VLVEAMVATAIVAMMLAVSYRAVGDSALRTRAAEASRTAALIAQSRLALVGSEIPLQSGETSGVDGDFAWRVRIEDADAAPSPMGRLMAVSASVRQGAARRDQVVLRTLRLAPAG
jgi:general secretion pathway protein I